MKKHIFQIVMLAALGFFASGCEGYLEEMPQNKLKPSSTDDYDQILNRGYVTKQIMPYLDILTDDFELMLEPEDLMTDTSKDLMSAYMWTTTHYASMPSGDIAFETLYESIFYTNVVIDNIQQATGVVLNESEVQTTRNNIEGEARALRAYSYFLLVNLYAKAYDPATAASDPGVPVNLSTAAEDKAYTRNTVQEVYDLMVDDLEKAIPLLENNPVKKDERYKFNALATKGLAARVYLYMHDWDNAIKYAGEVIAQNRSIFDLRPYADITTLDNNRTTSWSEITIPGSDYLGVGNSNILFSNGTTEMIPTMAYGRFSAMAVSDKLAACYETGDIRRCYFMHYYDNVIGTVQPTSRMSYAKNRYMAVNTITYVSANSRRTRNIRTEEMYLTLAEAHARKATPDLAATVSYLNQMREMKFRPADYVALKASDFSAQTLTGGRPLNCVKC